MKKSDRINACISSVWYRRLIKDGKRNEAAFLLELLRGELKIDISNDCKKETFYDKINNLGFTDQEIDDYLMFLENGISPTRIFNFYPKGEPSKITFIERTEKFILVKQDWIEDEQ
ncbi:hypothetical protein [Enterococcus faecium]|uniref:hypothetical protein n=2 Tax=Enterococcus faecium TaxID=1352 RepID=UPI0010BD70EF|nr:hypothetical protein [Enterococcus faecium]QCK21849.1 hypothetical protein EO217_00325 [Enterococcus faecium]